MTAKTFFGFLDGNRHVWFFIIWLFIAVLFQYNKIISLPPLSVHQGAQADRAGIALNYARVDANFLEPRVMETATKDGITSCEFPLINYTVGMLYKIFGYNPFWYRFLMWCLMGLGLWAAFDMAFSMLTNKWSALLLTFSWFFSSILVFYTPNFLPDTASLALMLLALRQWLKYQNKPTQKWVFLFTIFAALACLIKLISLVFVISIALINTIQVIKLKSKPYFIYASLVIFSLSYGWYLYCKWLEVQVGGSYFLMNIVMPKSFEEFKEWFHIFYANWFFQIYNVWQWFMVGLGILTLGFLKESWSLKWFVLLAFFGALSIYFLMAGQFRYHDYYIITLLPVCLFLLIFAFKALNTLNTILAHFLFLFICIYGMIDAKNNFRLRYTKGSYLYHTYFEPSNFIGVDDWLTNNGVKIKDRILAATDPNPNTLLYFLNRRGCRTNDHSLEYVEEKLNKYKNLVTTDSAHFFNQYPEMRDKLTWKSNLRQIQLYNLK